MSLAVLFGEIGYEQSFQTLTASFKELFFLSFADYLHANDNTTEIYNILNSEPRVSIQMIYEIDTYVRVYLNGYN